MQSIPKVIIGNPETQELAYDFIPNYRPCLGPCVTVRQGRVYHDQRDLLLTDEDVFILRLCDGEHTLHDILKAVAGHLGVGVLEAGRTVFSRLKWARSLNLVKRDNRFTDEGVFLRIRKIVGDGPAAAHWMYLPAFAQRVFTLCSGAFSCQEIAAVIAEENVDKGQGGVDPAALSRHVIDCCLVLERERIIAWIDHEHNRELRLKEYFYKTAREA